MNVTTTTTGVTGDLYAEIRHFYARQMRLVDSLRVDEFAETFTADGVVVHSTGERAVGREQMVAGMRANLPTVAGVATRHWFDQLLVEPAGDDVHVSYYALVSRTDATGRVTFAPTFLVEDVLVRQGGELMARSRVIHRDAPATSAAASTEGRPS